MSKLYVAQVRHLTIPDSWLKEHRAKADRQWMRRVTPDGSVDRNPIERDIAQRLRATGGAWGKHVLIFDDETDTGVSSGQRLQFGAFQLRGLRYPERIKVLEEYERGEVKLIEAKEKLKRLWRWGLFFDPDNVSAAERAVLEKFVATFNRMFPKKPDLQSLDRETFLKEVFYRREPAVAPRIYAQCACGEFRPAALRKDEASGKIICANCAEAERGQHPIGVCAKCGRTAPIEKDHKHGPFEKGAPKTGPFQPLCCNCHAQRHYREAETSGGLDERLVVGHNLFFDIGALARRTTEAKGDNFGGLSSVLARQA
jgi:hypothetical protein